MLPQPLISPHCATFTVANRAPCHTTVTIRRKAPQSLPETSTLTLLFLTRSMDLVIIEQQLTLARKAPKALSVTPFLTHRAPRHATVIIKQQPRTGSNIFWWWWRWYLVINTHRLLFLRQVGGAIIFLVCERCFAL